SSEVLDSEAHAPACACENGATVSGYRSSSQAPGEGANLGYENFLSAKDPATPPEPRYCLFSFHAFCWTTYKRRAIFRQSKCTLKGENRGVWSPCQPEVARRAAEKCAEWSYCAIIHRCEVIMATVRRSPRGKLRGQKAIPLSLDEVI